MNDVGVDDDWNNLIGDCELSQDDNSYWTAVVAADKLENGDVVEQKRVVVAAADVAEETALNFGDKREEVPERCFVMFPDDVLESSNHLI